MDTAPPHLTINIYATQPHKPSPILLGHCRRAHAHSPSSTPSEWAIPSLPRPTGKLEASDTIERLAKSLEGSQIHLNDADVIEVYLQGWRWATTGQDQPDPNAEAQKEMLLQCLRFPCSSRWAPYQYRARVEDGGSLEWMRRVLYVAWFNLQNRTPLEGVVVDRRLREIERQKERKRECRWRME